MGYASVGLLATEGLKWILIAFHRFPSWASLTWAVLNCPGFFGRANWGTWGSLGVSGEGFGEFLSGAIVPSHCLFLYAC